MFTNHQAIPTLQIAFANVGVWMVSLLCAGTVRAVTAVGVLVSVMKNKLRQRRLAGSGVA